jgi:predicted helicase
MSLKIIKTSTSWRDFVVQLEPLGKKQRGNAFELLTELFLQIDPIYRSKLRHIWHESDLPSGVRHKLNLPSPEIGVDLVAEDTSGGYWAIQCKYHHDPSKNVTKNELNSFLDVTTRVCRGKFKTLLAVTSAHGYSVNLHKHAPEVQYLLSDTFQSLDDEFFRQARGLIRNQTPKLKKRVPRPHQRTAIRNAVEHFVKAGESRGKLIHPCGTGKSLIGYWIAEALEARTILVALPSLYLVRQTLADWTKESLALKKQIDWMVVCSEDTIGDSGDPAMRFQEIGVDVTTKVDDITAFLRKRSQSQKVIFTTYQSGAVAAKAARKANRIFDVGIFDEAHRTVGQSDSMFAHLIDEKNIRIRKRVFMTATERRYQGSSDTILSMDDVDAYGDTFDKITFKEALEQPKPILSDYKIVTMFIGKSEIQHLIDENFLVKPDKGMWDDDTEARSLAALIALRKAMKKHRANHALAFHNSIAKAEAFKKSQERFNEAVKGFGKVDCYHVSSKVSTGERKQELERFRHSKKALITNAKCLTEGVDVPTIDAVLFADTKRSTVDIVQAAGRALRTAEGKKRGYIIVPVLVDEDDPDAADKAFQDVLMTLRAMASNDDRIIDYFRSVSQGKRPSKSDSIIDFVVPDPIKVRLGDFIENIETQSWHRLAKLSWMPFQLARAFVHTLKLKNKEEWKRYCKGEMPGKPPLPKDIFRNPQSGYEDKGWQGWGDWLGRLAGYRIYCPPKSTVPAIQTSSDIRSDFGPEIEH